MAELCQILILAAVQGICEFLPVSSSGHNAVINHLFEQFDNALAKDSSEFILINTVLHFGTLFAVAAVFRHRIVALFGRDRRILLMLAVAAIPLLLMGLPIHILFSGRQTCLPLISVCFALTGIMLLCTLLLQNGTKTLKTMSCRAALFIGLAQVLAVFPGISRLGITLLAGMFCGLSREESATFSFLLSIPVIAGAALWQCCFSATSTSIPIGYLLAAAMTSCLFGVFAVTVFWERLVRGQIWHFAGWVFLMALFTLVLTGWNP